MNLELHRQWPVKATTFGDLLVAGSYFCKTLEDQVREIIGRPVSEWKIKGETAIGAGRYDLGLVDSTHFGPNTITLLNVDGFDLVRMHSGVNKDSTEACIIVGDAIDAAADPPSISGGLNRLVLSHLKLIVTPAIMRGEKCSIEIFNPPGWPA